MSAITRKSQERAEVTKEKLQAATLSVLLREGWAGTSTIRICQEAGVSSGAQTHHYPKKSQLLIAALQRLRNKLKAQAQRRMNAGGESQISLLRYLQSLSFSKRDASYYYATLESLVAARTDEDLRQDIQRFDEEWLEYLRSMANKRIGDPPDHFEVEDIAELTLYMVRGMVVHRGVHQNPKHLENMFQLWCKLVEHACKQKEIT